MVSTTAASDMTVGAISRFTNRPKHRIEYVIKSRNIAPCRTAGQYRIFSETGVANIIAELDAIDKARAASVLRRMGAVKGVTL